MDILIRRFSLSPTPAARAAGSLPNEQAYSEASVEPETDFSQLIEEAVVKEFQPQLLTLVRNFLSELWNNVLDAGRPPDAIKAIRNPRAVWTIHQSVPSEEPRSQPAPIPLRVERDFAPRTATGSSLDVGVVERSSPSVGPRPGRPPLVVTPGGLFFASKMPPFVQPAALPDTPAARPAFYTDSLERLNRGFFSQDAAREHRRDWPDLWAAMTDAPSSALARLPVQMHFPRRSPAVMPIADQMWPVMERRRISVPTNLPTGIKATALPAPRTLSMALPVPPAPPLSEDTWAIQRVASGEQSAAPSASGSHQQDVNLASQEKGAAANDVHLLANEVWSLLKRRLETEAERIGRR